MAGRALVTAPAIEPVTVADAKLFARIDTNADDSLVDQLITAARDRLEQWRGRSMLTQTWDQFFDIFPRTDQGSIFRDPTFTPIGAQYRTGYPTTSQQPPLVLTRWPVQSVTSVTYYPASGGSVVLDPSIYSVDLSNTYANRLVPNFGRIWPADLLIGANGVAVRYIAGYGASPTDVPAQVRLAVKQLVSFWYTNRDALDTIPDSIANLVTDEGASGFAYA